MRRVSFVVGIVLAAVPLASTGAKAGGNFLEVSERYLAPGQTAVAHNRYFTEAIREHAPYYLYLLPESAGWSPPPRAYEDAPILGRARILWPRSDWSGPLRNNPRLRVKFTMPSVPPGDYLLALCDRPCENQILGIGFGSVRAVATPLEARLLERIDETESALWALRSRVNQIKRSQGERITDLKNQVALTDSLESRRMANLGERLGSARVTAAGASDSAHRANLVALGALAIAALSLLLRRRRPSSPVPPERTGPSIEEALASIEVTLEEPSLTAPGRRA